MNRNSGEDNGMYERCGGECSSQISGGVERAVCREMSSKMVRLMRDASGEDAGAVATLYAPVTCPQHSAVRFGSRRHCPRINTFMSAYDRFTPR